MLLNKLNKTDKLIYLGLFLIAFAVIICSSFSPMNFRRMHVDSAVYVTISQGITRGLLPYRDFADNKGPLLYLITVPGLFMGGFTGIWITELILMFVSVLFAYKTALFFGDRHIAFIGTTFSFVILLSFFNIHVSGEEYSMPFLMISLYIFAKHFLSQKQETKFTELIILGACLACSVLIKQNMFFLWLGFCMIIFAESIIKRRFVMLGRYVSGFCLGIIVIFLPVYLYLKTNGIINVFYEQVVIAGAARGLEATSLKDIVNNFYAIIHRNYSVLPLFFGLFGMITKYKHTSFCFYLGYTVSYFLTALFLAISGAGGSVIHYNMVFIPYFVPAVTFIVGLVHSVFSEKRIKGAVLILFFCIVFSEGLVRYLIDFSKIIRHSSGRELINAGKMIDENTNPDDTIIALRHAYIYPFTKRNAASKYIFQGAGLDLVPGASEEFISDILNNKPAIIAVFTAEDGDGSTIYLEKWHAPIYELMKNEYSLLSEENGYKLFKHN